MTSTEINPASLADIQNDREPPITTLVAGKPDLVLPYAGRTITDAATEIFRHSANSGRFFRRDQVAVRAVGHGASALIEHLSVHKLRSALETVGPIVKMRAERSGGPLLPQLGLITSDQANQLLGCTEGLLELPELIGTAKCPILANTPSGPVLCGAGYSRALKLWIFSDLDVPIVPVEEAVPSLLGLLEEFQFTTPSDRSRAFAAFITPMMHLGDWLPGQPVPVDVAEADQSQSGKTYRQKVVAAIYGDAPAYVNMKARGVGGVDESIQGLIFNGKTFISIDNAKALLDSEFIEQTVTNTTGLYQIRLPGMKQVEVRAKFILMISSNVAKMSRDLANRSSIIRIVKRIDYEFKSDPKAEVESRPGYFLGCVASIVREWVRRGKQRSSGVDHDFRAWAGALDYIVQNIAGLPPLLDGHRDAQVRANDPTLTFLREVALAVDGVGELGTTYSAAKVLELASSHGIELQGVESHPADDDAKATAYRSLGMKLKPVFKKSERITVDQYSIFRIEGTRERDGGKGPVTEIRYQFTKNAQPDLKLT
jgi:hypothetical protein